MAVFVSKGLFRFVGGRISKSTAVLFKSKAATIGIRGGVALMQFPGSGQVDQARDEGRQLPTVQATMLYGDEVFMQTQRQRRAITRAGFALNAALDGTINEPHRPDRAHFHRILSLLEEPQLRSEAQLAALTPEQIGPMGTCGRWPSRQ